MFVVWYRVRTHPSGCEVYVHISDWIVMGGTTEMSGHEGSSVCGTKRLTTLRILKQNGYPANFIGNASVPPTQETTDTHSCDGRQEEEKGPLGVMLYMAGMSENIRHV